MASSFRAIWSYDPYNDYDDSDADDDDDDNDDDNDDNDDEDDEDEMSRSVLRLATSDLLSPQRRQEWHSEKPSAMQCNANTDKRGQINAQHK